MEEELKRHFSRVPLSRVVRFRDEESQLFRSAPVLNISMGGMYIRTDDPHSQGTKVYLQFMLENGEIIAEGYGRVVHWDPTNGMGLEFVSIDEKFIAFTQLVVSEQLLRTRI